MKIINNEYIIIDDLISILKITSNKFGVIEVVINTENVCKCKKYIWSANKHKPNNNGDKYYFYITNSKVGLLHRYITDAPKDMVVDHINGNTLVNTLDNLQICTKKNNERKSSAPHNNKSGRVGVIWNKHIPTPKWMAYIKVDYKFINLGYYTDINDAINARSLAEDKYFGKFKPIQK